MARRIPTANGDRQNGDRQNGDRQNGEVPPPSTLAAQIVQHRTDPPDVQKQGTDATFAQLLYEISHNHAAIVETNIATNVKLINVVAEAGLGPLAENNPFAQWDVLIPQAITSIDVIEATIKRQPELLFTSTSQDGQQPLLPLLAKLFSVCGRPKCQDLPISRLLNAMLQALDASLVHWQSSQLLQHIFEDCMDEIVTWLGSTADAKAIQHLQLPSARSIARAWAGSAHAVALPPNYQTSITNCAQSFLLALQLSSIQSLPCAVRSSTRKSLLTLAPLLRPQLELSGQWDVACEELFRLPDCLSFLNSVLRAMLKRVPSTSIQAGLAAALVGALRCNVNSARDCLLPSVLDLASCEAFDQLQEDLTIAVATILSRCLPTSQLPGKIRVLQEALNRDDLMSESALVVTFRELSVQCPTKHYHGHRRKRRRATLELDQHVPAILTRRTTKLLTGVEGEDYSVLPEVAPSVYHTLSDDEQCAAWQALIDLAPHDPAITCRTVARLLETARSQCKQARILSILAVDACVGVTTEAVYLDLRQSLFGETCLRSLSSSLRETRIAAGNCLGRFLRNDLPGELKKWNRECALEYLRHLSSQRITNEQETLVSAWRQIAMQCQGVELNIALLKLVEYLGHSNPFINGLAFTELEHLVDVKSMPMIALLKPFWSTIAITVVQDLHSKPQMAQQLCDLLQMSVDQFLVLTQQDTVPLLVLRKKRDILEKVANACGHGNSVSDLLFQPRTNLMATLALLLVQPATDVEDLIMAHLIEVAPGLSGTDVVGLVKIDATLLACNLLKWIGDEDPSRRSRAYQAFFVFAGIAERRPGQGKSRSPRHVAELFDTHILGIMTHFSEVLENISRICTERDRVRCVNAIAEMINIAKKQVKVALPQIRAALQSAMEHIELCEASLSAWFNLLPVLDDEDLAQVINQTFALILRHWEALSAEVRQVCHKRVTDLVKSHNHLLQANISTLPSLKGIPLLAKVAGEIERVKSSEAVEVHCKAFTQRLKDESSIVISQALEELPSFLNTNLEFIHDSATSEQPGPVLPRLLRALLDVSAKCSDDSKVAELCARSLGIIGCIDPNLMEAKREKRLTLVLSNFDRADEVVDWVIVLLEDVLVEAFKSISNARAQGFLAFVMQELLAFCGFDDGTVLRPRATQAPSVQQKWMKMPEHVRITLTPFVTSKYIITSAAMPAPPNRAYPSFNPSTGHSSWLRLLVYDLMWKGKGDNAQMVFPLLARTVRGHDLSIANFMLPYVMLNVVLGGTEAEGKSITDEMLAVLAWDPHDKDQEEVVKLCSESVFAVLDYMSTWLREKKKIYAETRAIAFRTGHSPSDFDEAKDMGQMETAEKFLASIPAGIIANRAVLCGSYARALFNWEQHIRRTRPLIPSARPLQRSSTEASMYDELQQIYAQIDEPDGLEGISTHMTFLSEDQQAVQHVKAGRWTAAQAWYELQLAQKPQDAVLEGHLLSCFRETGRFEPLLRYADSFLSQRDEDAKLQNTAARFLPSVLEAQWVTGDSPALEKSLAILSSNLQTDFNVGIAHLLVQISDGETEIASETLRSLRTLIARSMTFASTASVQASHIDLRKLHVLHEVELMMSDEHIKGGQMATAQLYANLDRRLAVLGSHVPDKQYILGVRRAVMYFTEHYKDLDVGSSWLTTAKLARQSGNTEWAYNAVLKAFDCDDSRAKVEEARLLWRDGHQRHAIHSLESTIASGMFETPALQDANGRLNEGTVTTRSTSTTRSTQQAEQTNVTLAKVNLLLAKWLDASGQSQVKDLTDRFQLAARAFPRWEKGHYYLGRHYLKLLDAEKALPKERQSSMYQSGEQAKMVMENLIRSIPFGNKYWHQTVPKILTLWLDLGLSATTKARGEDQAIFDRRVKVLQTVTRQLQKYIDRSPAYVFYPALPQLISRISHPNPEIWKLLGSTLHRIVASHPSQALWSLLPVVKATDRVRVERGTEILNRLKDPKGKQKGDVPIGDLREMILRGQRLCDGLLRVSEIPIDNKQGAHVKLGDDLGFNHKLAPSQLVIPIEVTLAIGLPNRANQDMIRRHKAFVQDRITIQSFDEDVLVLSSLQRPRKLTVLGSNGKRYGILCKPHDDLRKDRRLMEFNGIINRLFKRDAESSKRQLYVKTYAVTPLSEESGIIEWVEGIKPMRDILLNLYLRRNNKPNYTEIKLILDQACAAPEHAHIFTDKLLPRYPPVLHEWFTEVYPEPEAWFAARLRYARSAAVMSMAGHVLGLGDRHGENILLEEGTGGVFHVDFNCLFDKGLTFDKPELVPFRLTHNMVDAMGPYGYEGPFRKSSELTLGLLRQSKDTLMTVLETFLYDPTTDFVGQKKKHKSVANVPETPQEILDGVDSKLKGLLRGEKVPLGVEGYVDALIREATSPFCLASMYIGWCAFL